MKTFRHAGDLGDILYAMPVMKALCGDGSGVLLIEAAKYTRQMLTPDKWCGINELLVLQPYVAEVRPYVFREPCTYNFNDFRARLMPSLAAGAGKEKHLGHWVCDAHGVPYSCMDEPWLTVEPNPVSRVVFSRTGPGRPPQHIYQNPLFPWHHVWARYGKNAVFIGTEFEHEIFCATCGNVPHYKTATLLDAAKVIAGCELFVGNQTATHAIAEGLKKRIVLEVWMGGPNCLVHRPGVVHGRDQSVELPDL